MRDYIREYYKNITDGTIVVGRWVRLFYSLLLELIDNGDVVYSLEKASKAVDFIQRFCHHTKTRNDVLILELWQKAFVAVIFGILDLNGNRQFREIVLIIGRKNGKTLLAAAIVAYAAYCDGEYGAEIYFIAPKLDQADIIYQNIKIMIELEPELRRITKSRKSDLYIAKSNSYFKKIAFSAKKSDGFNPHAAVCDEIASWSGRNGLKQYEVMTSALGARRQPFIISISTAGYENEGIYDELIKRSTRVLLGKSKEKRLAPLLYIIDDIEKWNDIEELKKSNPNLGVSLTEEYLQEQIAIAEGSYSKKVEFLVKHCNIKQNSSCAWLSSQVIEKNFSKTRLSLYDFKDCYCVGGIDLSQTTDLTACLIVIHKDGINYVFIKFFMPREKLNEAMERDGLPYDKYVAAGDLILSGDNYVDYKDCLNWFVSLVRDYKIYPLKIGYDRYSAQYLVQEMKQFGFHMDDCYQGENMTPVIREVEGELKDGTYCFDNNPIMKVHLLNSAVKVNAETSREKLIKIAPTERIDGTAALLDAGAVRQKYFNEIGEQLKNEKERSA